MISVGVVGASGFTGAELLRLLGAHPGFEVVVATGDTQAGTAVADLYPSLAAAYPHLSFRSLEDMSLLSSVELAFLALPHGASQELVGRLPASVRWVIDLSADFRLRDPSLYPSWYGAPHTAPELLVRFVYGLPELFRKDLAGAARVAVPGCYPTAASLALAPLVEEGLVEPSGLIVDAASGVSGAGRTPKPSTAFCTVDEDFTAYGLLSHRHTPEMEQVLASVAPDGEEVSVLFTPHLAPMNRGILATCYARPRAEVSTGFLLDLYRERYAGEPFLVVSDRSPSTKAALGSNSAHLTVRFDERTGWVVALCAIDNLVKGASGQAIQCANLLTGQPEETGLSAIGVYP
ncbi:N-acetyl-gamma-glutamyl-phosphate reductase [Rhabdothermincola sediminis]|uniref:N-acetyl-gamma-glutamyl-phosphate reductase n=1 Tax=Rhabdothermincola sediminis TaxID=2751370 RepID=UPI001AA06596|nr:N-acetyl-gamma-glutamyl-phosphate reductase [Rhabdothermincola sediminis]